MTEASLETIETQNNTDLPITARNIEVVFRTVGERTSDKALELVQKHIKPNKIHIIKDARPFSVAFNLQLQIHHDCSHIVYVDPDCLILEDLRPFLDYNNLPFVDGYSIDRFVGVALRGIHIVRRDVFERMREHIGTYRFEEFVMNPETFLIKLALTGLGFNRRFKNIYALHDFFQSYEDIFAKYVLRGLKYQSIRKSAELKEAIRHWPEWDTSFDFVVAKHAFLFCTKKLAEKLSLEELEKLIENLPHIAKTEVAALKLPTQTAFSDDELDEAVEQIALIWPRKPAKVFGIGLSRTGTTSLTRALHTLNLDTVHYPTDKGTLGTLGNDDGYFPLLEHYDGITDVTTIPFYKKLDKLYPGSRFILTTRDEDSWLRSCRIHWERRQEPKWPSSDTEQYETIKKVKKLVRERVYGTYDFDRTLFIKTYRQHLKDVTEYFKGREQDLLVLDITKGDGYEKLAPFLNVPIPNQPFPHQNETGKDTKKDTLEAIVEARIKTKSLD